MEPERPLRLLHGRWERGLLVMLGLSLGLHLVAGLLVVLFWPRSESRPAGPLTAYTVSIADLAPVGQGGENRTPGAPDPRLAGGDAKDATRVQAEAPAPPSSPSVAGSDRPLAGLADTVPAKPPLARDVPAPAEKEVSSPTPRSETVARRTVPDATPEPAAPTRSADTTDTQRDAAAAPKPPVEPKPVTESKPAAEPKSAIDEKPAAAEKAAAEQRSAVDEKPALAEKPVAGQTLAVEPKPAPEPKPAAKREPAAEKKPEPAPKPGAEDKIAAEPPAATVPAASASAAVAGRPGSHAGAEAPTGEADHYAAAIERVRQRVAGEGGGLGGDGDASKPASLGGSGSGGGDQVVGAEFLIYYNILMSRIRQAWLWVGHDDELAVSVRFVITPEGQIQGVRIDQSSGNSAYDASVLKAIHDANPLPPPPPAYLADFGDVLLRVRAGDFGAG